MIKENWKEQQIVWSECKQDSQQGVEVPTANLLRKSFTSKTSYAKLIYYMKNLYFLSYNMFCLLLYS